MSDPRSTEELVFEFLELTPEPRSLASYWESKARRYKAAYLVSERVLASQAKLIGDQFKRIRVLENALRMAEKERSRR